MIRIIAICLGATVLGACSSTSFDSLMEQLEFECGETGEVSISTNLDLNSNPVISSNTAVIYTKKKEDPNAGCPVDGSGEGHPNILPPH